MVSRAARRAWSVGRRQLLARLVVCVAVCGWPAAAQAAFSWSAPSRLDNDGGQFLFGVVCSSSTQCTTVDYSGQETTFDPSSPGDAATATIDPGVPLYALACASATQCTAVDEFDREVTFDPSSPGSPSPAFIDDATPDAVACPSTAQCTAVDEDGQEVTFNPAAPSVPTPVAIDAGNPLTSVTCLSLSECIAVDAVGQVVTFDPTSPGSPAHPVIDPGAALNAVTCLSSSQCVAVGYVGASPDETGSVVVFDPSSPAGAATGAIDSGPGHAFQHVTCQPGGDCTAVDNHGQEFTFSPGNPGSATSADIDGNIFLTGSACTTSSQCLAVDEFGREVPFDPSAGTSGTAVTIDGGVDQSALSCLSGTQCVVVDTFGQEVTFNPESPETTPAPTWVDKTAGFDDVVCQSAMFCVGVDSKGNVVTFNPTTPGTPTTTDIDSTNELLSLACPTAMQCTAVDNVGNEITFNPASPSGAIPIAIDKGADLWGVACTSSAECTAVADGGKVFTFTPTTGGSIASATVDSPNALFSVACPTTTQCTAVDGAGNEVTYDPATAAVIAGPTSIDPGTVLTAVACASQSDCVATDFFGNVVEGDPQSASAWTNEHLENGNALTDIACPGATECVAADRTGQDFLGTNSGSTPAPVNTFPPSIFGTAQQSQTLTESHGSWTENPTSYTYQWYDCDSSGANCIAIQDNATGQTYVPVSADVGHTLEVKETAHNAGGASLAVSSGPTGVVLPAVPVLTAPGPSISGAARQGATLTVSSGSWENNPTFDYQWEDCDGDGANCIPIAGAADADTYTLGASDVGFTIVVQVTATNNAGASHASSRPTDVVLPLPPVDSTPPAISGVATQGQTLTESHGSWTDNPTGFTYQWEDCDSSGNNCTAINMARNQTYVLEGSDVGSTIRVQETASNDGGAGARVSSAPTAVVQALVAPPTPPASISPPTVSGQARVGGTLTATTGAWSGTPPLSYAYQWERCTPRRCMVIAGANAARLKPTRTSIGNELRVVVTATNAVGSGQGTSAEVGPTAPSVAAVRAALRSALVPTGPLGLIGALLANNGYSFTFIAPGGGLLKLSWSLAAGGGSAVQARPRVLAGLVATFSKASRKRIKIVLTPTGRRLLSTASRLTVTATGSFKPPGAPTTAARRTFTLALG